MCAIKLNHLSSVEPFLPLIGPDFLIDSNAVFIGVVHDDLYGYVNAWQLLVSPLSHNGQIQAKFKQFSGTLPVTVYLDANNTLVRYDFSAPGPLRTFATTRFFDIIPGPVNKTVFDTPCG